MGLNPFLIPTELWEYRLLDAFRNLRVALFSPGPLGVITLPDVGPSAPVRSARAGIVLALKALDLGPGARVGVPLYCCPVVFKAIKAAGCEPRFVDVDARTFCVSPADAGAKRGELDALVAVHMFGHVCDVPRLRAAIGGKPIVEDCAQSLGSRLLGRVTGEFGDVAVYSFRSGKYLSVGEGGALFSANPDLRSKLVQAVSALAPPPRTAECRHVVKSYLRSKLRSRPLYGLIGCDLWRVYNRAVSDAAKSPLTVGAAFLTDLTLARQRIGSLESAIEIRRAYSAVYSASLPGSLACAETPDAFFNRYQYPLLFSSDVQRDAVAAHLSARGIDTSKPYHDIARVARQLYGYDHDCPEAERVAARILVIPNHEGLTPADVQHVSRSVRSALEATATLPAHPHPNKAAVVR